jgi:hypothetical protein
VGAPLSSVSGTRLGRRDWLWLAAIWLIAAATLLARVAVTGADAPFFGDTDDAMRMVVVRDFLAGQNWFDPVQARLNTPFGADIHWSRLVDLPLAVMLWLARQLVEPDLALRIAGTLWPLGLLAVLLYLSLRITVELVGTEGRLPALVLPILSPPILAEFTPGRVDHHNVIIVLSAATLLAALVAHRRPLIAVLAGLLAATSIAIATEALPVAVATVLAFGFGYVLDPHRAASLRRFGLAFAGGMIAHLLLARPADQWLVAACDALSPVYVLAGLVIGAAYILVSLVPAPRAAWQRLALLAVLGAAAMLVVALAYPQCLAGPYGELDPWLRDNWMNAVMEAKPWHRSFSDGPAYPVTVATPVILAIIVSAIAFRREPHQRLGWLTLLVFLVTTALIMLVQIRGARLAILPTLPAAGWLILQARERYLARGTALRAGALIGAWLAFSGIILTVLVNVTLMALPTGTSSGTEAALTSKQSCLLSGNFADLRALPPKRIMAPIDLGAHILLETPHAVVGAPYHRNEDGMLDTFRFLNGTAEQAREIATRRGLGLFVTCDAMPELAATASKVGSVPQLLAAGTPPDWLREVSLGGPLKVYAIVP